MSTETKNAFDGQEQKKITAKELIVVTVENIFTAFVANRGTDEAKE